MNDAIDLEILEVFIQEAEELLLDFEEAALNLEQSWQQDRFDDLCRSAHNLKGSAQGTGLDGLGEFVHKVETLMELNLSADASGLKQSFSALLLCQDFMLTWVRSLHANAAHTPPYSNLLELWPKKIAA